jgi:hypothetical protein
MYDQYAGDVTTIQREDQQGIYVRKKIRRQCNHYREY